MAPGLVENLPVEEVAIKLSKQNLTEGAYKDVKMPHSFVNQKKGKKKGWQ